MLVASLTIVMSLVSPDGLREKVRAGIEGLSRGTAWSRIAWETCIAGAYSRAAKEGKPVLIWALGGDPEGRC